MKVLRLVKLNETILLMLNSSPESFPGMPEGILIPKVSEKQNLEPVTLCGNSEKVKDCIIYNLKCHIQFKTCFDWLRVEERLTRVKIPESWR